MDTAEIDAALYTLIKKRLLYEEKCSNKKVMFKTRNYWSYLWKWDEKCFEDHLKNQ